MATLSLVNFFDSLKVDSYTFELNENLISSRDGSGQLLVSSLGPRLWNGTVNLSAVSLDEYRRVKALLQTIQKPENSFFIYDIKGQKPQKFVTGDVISNVKLASVTVSGYSVSLIGLPANYVLSAGDYISLVKSGIRLLYQLSADATADATGAATVSLVNPITAGIAANSVVLLNKPQVTARYVPNSLNLGVIGKTHVEGMSFDWVQTFKA